MNILDRNLAVSMVRPNLDDIPIFALPDGYSIRRYQRGDEQAWVRIHVAADRYNLITPALFQQQFGAASEALTLRQLYLVDSHGTAVGTTSAWLDDRHKGDGFGRIHWVAIVPECQGLGLSKPLLSQACRLLRSLGHSKAYLDTSTARVVAINLYLSFGFTPEIDSAEAADVWRELAKHLKAAPAG